MPTFGFREWLVGLIAGVVCFAFNPLASRNTHWFLPLAWFYALIMFFNGMGHTVFTIFGRIVASVTFSRLAPGFYSSPFLCIGSVWLMMRLWRRFPTAALQLRRKRRQTSVVWHSLTRSGILCCPS